MYRLGIDSGAGLCDSIELLRRCTLDDCARRGGLDTRASVQPPPAIDPLTVLHVGQWLGLTGLAAADPLAVWGDASGNPIDAQLPETAPATMPSSLPFSLSPTAWTVIAGLGLWFLSGYTGKRRALSKAKLKYLKEQEEIKDRYSTKGRVKTAAKGAAAIVPRFGSS